MIILRINRLEVMRFVYYFAKQVYLFLFCKNYISAKRNTKKIFISYLSEPFYKINDICYLNAHQNRRETLVMARVFEEMNYSFKFVRLDKPLLNIGRYDIIFGVEPNFINACNHNPTSIKIYYATGAYYEHQNNMIRLRTDTFNRNKSVQISYSRLVMPHNSCEIADFIIQIGSDVTINTYPEKYRNKIIKIRQSCHDFTLDTDYLSRKKKSTSFVDFVWMGSKGSILKGLDIVVDFFLEHATYNLHIIGEIDSDVRSYYDEKIQNASNIRYYGFLDLDSDLFMSIAMTSIAVLMPSASEGCPGAVINLMKLGCIPIVSKYAAVDDIEDLGYLIEDFSVDALEKSINKLFDLSVDAALKKIEDNYMFANSNYNLDIFRNDFRNAFLKITNSIHGIL